MMTIPLNSNTGIRIPARTPPEKPKHKRTENTERISVSIQEAAKMLGISKPHFLPLIKEGKIRTIQIGRRTLVSAWRTTRNFWMLARIRNGGQSLRWQGLAGCGVLRNCNSCGGRM